MTYRKRSDYRTMPLPEVTEEFKLAIDHLMVYESATFMDMVEASKLTADLDKLDVALRWLVAHKFVRFTNECYTRELRLRGLERRIWPREPEQPEPQRWPGQGLAVDRPDSSNNTHEALAKALNLDPEPKPFQGPRLLLLQTR